MDNKHRIREFLARFLRNQLRDDDDIFAMGLVNSLFAMQLIMHIEKDFGITVEDQDLDINNFKSINRIDAFIERTRNATVREVTINRL